MGGQSGAILGAAIGGGAGAAIAGTTAAPQQVQAAPVKVSTVKRHRDEKGKDHHDHDRKHDKDHDD
jgi:hypothetical protein